MCDWIHLDEKWFFLTQEKERYLLLLEEKNPQWCVKHKSHIIKVMFLCAVTHPRFNPSANSWWDGKLGIWPIGDWELAKCKFKNRPREHWCGRIKQLLKRFIESYLYPSCFWLSWRNGPGQTGFQENFLYNNTVQNAILVRTTMSSMMH